MQLLRLHSFVVLQQDELWNALLDDCGKTARNSSTLACKWLFWLLLFYFSKDYEQVLRCQQHIVRKKVMEALGEGKSREMVAQSLK
ncbi:hypothetical protein BIY23_00205 [Wolbachia pipientis]|uniref:Uncharacterized protein n=1 Tax=Wolbachia pipientis TaxID=955 RepID=A0A1E7QKP6_WOLPI|nr:hypothetical protein BIY23_00205 [Wolbachia pipientis]